MAFKWNGTHARQMGLTATAETLPFIPQPRTVLEELPGRDGFLDYTNFNPAGRTHYRPRDWTFRCYLPISSDADRTAKLNEIAKKFAVPSGRLEADACPGVYWDAVINNGIEILSLARNMREFYVYFRSQAFSYGFEPVVQNFSVTGDMPVSITNPGTWHVRPDLYLTGTANNAMVGDMPVGIAGTLDNSFAFGPELVPGTNEILVTGFSGYLRIEFIPQFLWGA